MPFDATPVLTSDATEQTETPEVQILRLAREIIAPKERWCTWAEGRNRLGGSIDPTSFLAARRCAYGAMKRAQYVLGFSEADFQRAYDLVPMIISTNDVHGHSATLQVFDEAIAREG